MKKVSPSPSKKICLPATSARGVKNEAIAAFFTEYIPGRKRCTPCYDKWFAEWVEVLNSQGKTETAARSEMLAREPPVESVPNFVKAGTDSIRIHLIKHHHDDPF